MLGFVRELYDNVVLTVVNLSERNFAGHGYGVGDRRARRPVDADSLHAGRGVRRVGRRGQCLPRALDAGGDGRVYINLPKWSVVIFRRI